MVFRDKEFASSHVRPAMRTGPHLPLSRIETYPVPAVVQFIVGAAGHRLINLLSPADGTVLCLAAAYIATAAAHMLLDIVVIRMNYNTEFLYFQGLKCYNV